MELSKWKAKLRAELLDKKKQLTSFHDTKECLAHKVHGSRIVKIEITMILLSRPASTDAPSVVIGATFAAATDNTVHHPANSAYASNLADQIGHSSLLPLNMWKRHFEVVANIMHLSYFRSRRHIGKHTLRRHLFRRFLAQSTKAHCCSATMKWPRSCGKLLMCGATHFY